MADVSSPGKKKGSQQLRGPRPHRLKVSSSKKAHGGGGGAPVIVYEHTPRVVHARPQEFMTVVQRLTGMPAPVTTCRYSSPPQMYYPTTYVNHPPATGFSPARTAEEGGGAVGSVPDLLLTLGQRQAAPAMGAVAGVLMSPGDGFIFSPNTIQEITPLF